MPDFRHGIGNFQHLGVVARDYMQNNCKLAEAAFAPCAAISSINYRLHSIVAQRNRHPRPKCFQERFVCSPSYSSPHETVQHPFLRPNLFASSLTAHVVRTRHVASRPTLLPLQASVKAARATRCRQRQRRDKALIGAAVLPVTV